MPRIASLLCAAMLSVPLAALVLPARAATPPAQDQAATGQDQSLSKGEIEALVAPIALYSDPLLTKVLMASTYPLEIVEAERWVSENSNLKGDALASAAAKQKWDDSVKQLTAVPTVLKMMSDRLDWTQKLGNAVLAQQSDVLAAIQTLRGQAQAKGNLKSTPEQTVTQVPVSEGNNQGGGGNGTAIVIEPTQAETVYVPYYDTKTVYGDWAYPSYPPTYWPPPYGYSYPGYGYGLGFMTGALIGAAWGNGWWGSGANWGGGYINHYGNVNFNNFNNYRNNIGNGNRWNHNPAHRGGVNYPNNALRNQYGRGQLAGANGRRDFRGLQNNLGQGNLGNRGGLGQGNRGNLGQGNRGNLGQGNRGGLAGNRGNLGNRGGLAGNAGNRGNRGNLGNRGNIGNRGGFGQGSVANRGNFGSSNFGGRNSFSGNGFASRGGGFDGLGNGGGTRNFSNRGRTAMSGGFGGGRGYGGGRSFGGGGRGGFSGGRGGGMRGGGGRGGGRRR